jgi:tellurite resistance protein TerC
MVKWYVRTYKQARRLVIFVIGSTLLLAGILMVVLPGPAIIVIPLALLLLASEFVWAKQLLLRFEQRLPARLRKRLKRT